MKFLNKNRTILIIICAAMLVLSIPLLDSDSIVFIKWWIVALVIGIGFYPLTSKLFSKFTDRGWIFSKVLGILITGYLAFTFITCGAAKFTAATVIICTVIPMAICWSIFMLAYKRGKAISHLQKEKTAINIELIIFEELLFIALFLIWTYFAGFRPEAKSTEKFMDYGFMAAMMRDSSLPAKDIWYSPGTINYYYGGQYYAVFLTKLTGTAINQTYNLMRTFVAGLSFVMPFSIVYSLVQTRKKAKAAVSGLKSLGTVAGLLSGAAVTLAGNVHYVLYGVFGNVFKLSGYEDYWFPSSTRYIGHNPATDDACIHEFPSYSFVLGDLHAHVVNVMYVLLLVGILYAWFRKNDEIKMKRRLADPHVWLLGIMLGIFRFTNYWDFIIYLTVAVIGFALMIFRQRRHGSGIGEIIIAFIIRAVLIAALSTVVSIPFEMNFKTMTSGLALSVYHSEFYQLAILWGLPVAAVVGLLIYVITDYIKRNRGSIIADGEGKKRKKTGFIAGMEFSDMFALLIGICAIGLVIVPEVIYAVDIYNSGLSRCNTMFKMTYQAYILFGMSMIYGIIKIIFEARKVFARILAWIMLVIFALTLGYFPYAVSCWLGDVFSKDGYQGLDATTFLDTEYPEDVLCIRWLNSNVYGEHVVLEANGDSYSEYERISAFTGLPTVIGWTVHEWLWRSDLNDVSAKGADVTTIYTSDDEETVKALIEKYDIEYIVVGSCEREKYTALNETLLKSLGEVVFESSSEISPSYIIQVGD